MGLSNGEGDAAAFTVIQGWVIEQYAWAVGGDVLAVRELNLAGFVKDGMAAVFLSVPDSLERRVVDEYDDGVIGGKTRGVEYGIGVRGGGRACAMVDAEVEDREGDGGRRIYAAVAPSAGLGAEVEVGLAVKEEIGEAVVPEGLACGKGMLAGGEGR